MSETKNLKLFKHDEPLETNENQFNIKKALHDNWDKLDEFGGKVNTKTVEIENKQKQHDTDISNIKQEQQEQNLKIENNTTESKDNTELLNQIMGLLPSTKGEGENVTLDDTAEARFKKFEVQGNSKQETRSGKNAIKSLNRQAKTHISWVLDKSKLEKKMYFSLIASKDLSSTNSIFFNVIDGSLTAINKSAMVIKANVKSIRQIDFTEEELNTLKNSDKDIILQIYENNAEIDCTTITFSEVMLANSNNTDYEKYGASPSLEFPSKIRNDGDNINWFNKDGNHREGSAKFEKIETGIKVTVQSAGNYRYIWVDLGGKELLGKKLTMSSNIYANAQNDPKVIIYAGTKTSPSKSIIKGAELSKSIQAATFQMPDTFPEGTDSFRVYFYGNFMGTSQVGDYVEYRDFKIEEGTQATAYSPYDCGNTKVIVCNKNLAVSDFEQYYNSPTAGYVLCPLKLKKGSTYKFTAKLTGVQMAGLVNYGIVRDGNSYEEFVSNARFVLDLSGKIFNEEFTIDDKFIAPKLVCWAKTEDIFNNLFKNYEIQLVEKTNTDSFVQHKQQTIVFPFTEGQKLYKGDYLAEDGIHHARKQIVLDGTENWEHDSMGGTETCVCYKYKINDYEGYEGTFAPTGKLMCNYLKEQKIYANEQEGIIGGFGPYIFVKVKKSLLETPDFPGFKKWLAKRKDEGNPFVIEYPLMQEIIEPYTSEQQEAYNKLKKLHSYNEQTNIFSTNEIGPIFNAEAIKNLNVSVLQQTTKES